MKPSALQTSSYEALKIRVYKTLHAGMERAEQLIEIEKARTYWETGRLIDQHIKKEKPEAEHAAYGKQVVLKLATDLKTNKTYLYYGLQFARAYPIFPAPGKLGWTQYRALLTVEDTDKRKVLEAKAVKQAWTSRELERKVEEINDAADKAVGRKTEKKAPPRFIPKRGKLNTYRMDKEDKVDLGFSAYRTPDLRELIGFKEGDILEFRDGKFIKLKDATRADIYTYKASVAKVVDGDTIWVEVNLGFHVSMHQKLRLRGIDAPELSTKAGEEAKRFVENEMKKIKGVVITTTKPDKFDRYLTDVYLGETEGAPCLNKILLDKGLAFPMKFLPENHWDDSNTGRF